MNSRPTSTPQSQSDHPSGSTEIASASFAAVEASSQKGPAELHYSALAQMVAEVSQDHTHLRSFIYEFARIKLRKELYPLFLEGAWSEIEDEMRSLENAIDEIEAEFAQSAPVLPFKSQAASRNNSSKPIPRLSAVASRHAQGTTRFGEGGIHTRSLLAPSNAHESSPRSARDAASNAVLGKSPHLRFSLAGQMLVAAALGVAIYATFDAKTVLNSAGIHWLDKAQAVASGAASTEKSVLASDKGERSKTNAARRERVGDVPVPTEYGAYAVVGGRLIGLEQLAIRVPDPRVAISAAFALPSNSHLSSNPNEFVVFRKDLLNGAPDRAAVRVVAQVARVLSFDTSGKPKTSNVEQSWVIRNNAYSMRVGPFPDNPEMIIVRSEQAGLSLPAGRYVLVLKGVGYDFTVDGPVTDPAHCLERTEALNAPIYSECPKP
jgi:hypothetical protein